MDKKGREIAVPCLEDFCKLQEKCQKLGLKLTTSSLNSSPVIDEQSPTCQKGKKRLKTGKSRNLNWENKLYEVESILDTVTENGKRWYLVKWKGWHADSSSWEPREHLAGCEYMLGKFYRQAKRNKINGETSPRTVSAVVINQSAFLSMKYNALKIESSRRLQDWQRDLNRLCSDPAGIFVVNNVDLEGPPENFTYINDYKAGEGIVIPDDPLVGCECADCHADHRKCCAHQSGGQFAYNKYGRVIVPCGSPIYECNRRCSCGPDCPNRVVQKGRKVKVGIFRTGNGCGWGVMAMEVIRKHQFVMEYVGEVITSDEAERRGADYDAAGRTYLFDLDYNDDDCPFTVDAAYYGNISHFVNHSCDPNLVQYGVWINGLDPRIPKIAFFAARTIDKGEQLTFDYKMNSAYQADDGSPDTKPKKNRILCKCASPNCRKYVF